MNTKICIECKREYPATYEFFNKFKKGTYRLDDVCIHCQSLRNVCGFGPKARKLKYKKRSNRIL